MAGAVLLGGITALRGDDRLESCDGRRSCSGNDGPLYRASIGITATLGALGGGLFGAFVAARRRWRLLLP